MTCNDRDAFFQGRLATADADRFRDHLAGCARCQRDLHTDMQVEVSLWARAVGAAVLLCLALVSVSGCAGPEGDLVMPSSSFVEIHGVYAAPVGLRSGESAIGAVVDLTCPDAPARLVAVCARSTDPLNPSAAQVWCALEYGCDSSVAQVVVPMPTVTVEPRRMLDLVVASPTLERVRIRGAIVAVD